MNKAIKVILGNSWIEMVLRWILGATFVYASYHKILAPADFAKIIYGYDLFPAVVINLIAIILPFMELVAGLALIFGFYPRSAALIVNGMLVVFTVVLAVNLIRGHEFDCGCFTPSVTDPATFSGPMLARNFIFLALGLHVFLFRNSRRLCILAG